MLICVCMYDSVVTTKEILFMLSFDEVQLSCSYTSNISLDPAEL